jgi:hypothetical protein
MYLSARSCVAVAKPALDMEPAATERVKIAWASLGVWVPMA